MKILIYLVIGLIYALIVWRLEEKEREKFKLSRTFKGFWFIELILLWPVEIIYEIFKKWGRL